MRPFDITRQKTGFASSLCSMKLNPLSVIARSGSCRSFDPSDTSCGQTLSTEYLKQNTKRSKPLLALWGTCQITPLMWALSHTRIASEYDILQLGLNFLLSNKSPATIQSHISSMRSTLNAEDLILMTPVHSCKLLNTEGLLRSFGNINIGFLPYVVNTGYFPLYQTRSGWKGMEILNRATLRDIIRGCYEFNLSKRFKESLEIIENREKEYSGIAWGLSSFIQRESKKKRLFYTYNHPSWSVFKYLCEKIGDFVGIDIEGELDDICLDFESCYINDNLHPWAQVNSCITPYALEHGWNWVPDSIDSQWRFKYASLVVNACRC